MQILIADADELLSEILQPFPVRFGHKVETDAKCVNCISLLRKFMPESRPRQC